MIEEEKKDDLLKKIAKFEALETSMLPNPRQFEKHLDEVLSKLNKDRPEKRFTYNVTDINKDKPDSVQVRIYEIKMVGAPGLEIIQHPDVIARISIIVQYGTNNAEYFELMKKYKPLVVPTTEEIQEIILAGISDLTKRLTKFRDAT